MTVVLLCVSLSVLLVTATDSETSSEESSPRSRTQSFTSPSPNSSCMLHDQQIIDLYFTVTLPVQ